jgi:L-histidine N-alpha-methyltransferase
VPPPAATLETPVISAATHAVAAEVRRGLTATPKTLSPWLFYDEAGSRLFEEITALPEYYLTRVERELFTAHADEILALASGSTDGRHGAEVTVAELGAGTAAKTGILLRALTQRQPSALYQPIDISPTALDEARRTLERGIPGLSVRACTANYVTDDFTIMRPPGSRVLALYIGSSIGNFSPAEARAILVRLRSQLQPGDSLLLGTDLAPSVSKPIARLLAAYNDAAGVTAAFNRNVLHRLNRDLGADFDPERFAHRALWNPRHSRMEMHLESQIVQTIYIPGMATVEGASAHRELQIRFAAGETIHTENSYKFDGADISNLLEFAGFAPGPRFTDAENLFAVTFGSAV